MVTQTDICNFALSKIGNSKKTVNIDQPVTAEDKACALWYDNTRQVALRTGLFNFSVKRAILALPVENTPAFGWSYQYKLPQDCLKLLGIGSPGDDYDYDVEGGYILTDYNFEGKLPIRYIRDVKDPNEYDALFIKYFSTLLAVELASDVNKNSELRNLMEELSSMYKQMAQTASSNETKIIKISRSKFMASKYGFVKGNYKK